MSGGPNKKFSIERWIENTRKSEITKCEAAKTKVSNFGMEKENLLTKV